jgi:hypothetical protein
MPIDPILRWENEGGAVLPIAGRQGGRRRESDARLTPDGGSGAESAESVAAASPPPSAEQGRRPQEGAGGLTRAS